MYNKKVITRFSTVGVVNTAVDLSLFLILRTLGFNIITANILSTSAALINSFFLNHSYTFRLSSPKAFRQFVKFAVITIFGLWVLQPLIIMLAAQFTSSELLSKLLAIAVSMAWNYIWYSKYIFRANKLDALETQA